MKIRVNGITIDNKSDKTYTSKEVMDLINASFDNGKRSTEKELLERDLTIKELEKELTSHKRAFSLYMADANNETSKGKRGTLECYIGQLENYKDISPYNYKDLILLLYELKAYREHMRTGKIKVNIVNETIDARGGSYFSPEELRNFSGGAY